MNYSNFISIFFPAHLKPWEHDYYIATFQEDLGEQGFADYCFTNIEGLDGLWFRLVGTTAYFVVKKGTTLPDEFGTSVTLVTDIPTEPDPVTE